MASEKERLHQLHYLLRASFAHVKRDTHTLYNWVQFLNNKIQQQERTITALHNYIRVHTPTRSEVNELAADKATLKHVTELQSRLHQINRKIELLGNLHDGHTEHIREMRNRIETAHTTVEKKTSALQQRLIKRFARNSKSYIKNTILGFIEKYEEVPALQLKEMVVDEQKLCSKSSFYRLLQELEDSEQVAAVKDGKQKFYAKLAKVKRV